MSPHAIHNPCRATGRRFDQAFLLLATLCVIVMPSIYNGGAEFPHPHAFFQFWISGPERAFEHHHGEGEHDHADHEHAAHESGMAAEVGSGLTDVANRDEPRISPETFPGGSISVIAMTVMALAVLAGPMIWKLTYPRRMFSWLDRRISPEPPPPRLPLLAL
jgi:hypothetical protein